jgi:hypothetical protein
VDSLVAAGFQTDQASGAFHNSYTQFNTGVNQTLEGLVGMSQYLTKAQEAMAVKQRNHRGTGSHASCSKLQRTRDKDP